MKKILVVDDEPYMLALLKMTLEVLQCQISLASDGTEALRTAFSEKPDLILLDKLLPDMDGLEVCRRLKASEYVQEVKVFLVTAAVDPSGAEVATQAGADGYLEKPFSPEDLLTTIARALGVSPSL